MSFAEQFEALTGHRPFPWQTELHARIKSGNPPSACDLPTGLGKTSVIAVWLLALANGGRDVQRRLVYVVNRRTVVDQATAEVEAIRKRVLDLERPELRPIAETLANMSAIRDAEDHVPLAISTLRGQFADNREWSADPSRPAIILGTVDMIGSRLLFSGYGLGFKTKPLHAGFLAQDVLLVHDEAHLEPAFQELLTDIKREQDRCKEFGSFRVMELSATSRAGQDDAVRLVLSDEDREHPVIRKRISAKKTIHLHELDDPKKTVDRMYELAVAHEGSHQAVIVFARSVEDVKKVAEKLQKLKNGEARVRSLTGTMRGLERDELVKDSVFLRFVPNADRDSATDTVYLVCTSAGEVGVNISGDHLVCDLTTYESMAQRFGRVNRFGECFDTRIDIVHPKSFDETDKLGLPLKKTLDLLRRLDGDGSPAALNRLDPDERYGAFAPKPKTIPITDILLDAWSMTSIRDKLPGRPPVEPYLHGAVEDEPPETSLAWRDEVQIITDDLLASHKPKDLLEVYPLKPHELLKDRTDRVFKGLQTLAKKHPDEEIWIVDNDGDVRRCALSKLADKEEIRNRTVLLPPKVGGLKGGLFTGNPADVADDVSEKWFDKDGDPRRLRLRLDEMPRSGRPKMRLIRIIDTDPAADDRDESERESPGRYWAWYARARSADEVSSKTSDVAVTWDDHTNQVVDYATRIVRALNLSSELQTVIRLAAKWHDLGKRRELWQRDIGNPEPTDWHAKSGGDWKPLNNTLYRHEFGSLLDSLDHAEFQALDSGQRDLVLHLVTTHHGYGRPHFPAERIFDPIRSEAVVDTAAREVASRFARLQRKYGRWGLAYIESLLRAADYAASANPHRTGASHS